MRILMIASMVMIPIVSALAGGNFEPLFDGHGNIISYIYFKQNADYFIDTELNGSVEAFRYRKFFLNVDLFKETHMGRKYHSNMVFDPTRAHWSFGLTGRMEYSKYFVEAQMHHDCFHDIDRFRDNSVYWNSPRLGFGTLGYLAKYRYHDPDAPDRRLIWEKHIDYYLLAGFFAPKGGSFQKGHDYKFTFNTNFRLRIFRYRRIGVEIDSDNLWLLDTSDKFRRRHRLDFDMVIYGEKGAMVVFLRTWPYDNQSIRNHSDHRFAFGINLGF